MAHSQHADQDQELRYLSAEIDWRIASHRGDMHAALQALDVGLMDVDTAVLHTVCMQPHGIALPNCNKYMGFSACRTRFAHLHGDQRNCLIGVFAPWSIMAASLAVERGLGEAARIHLQDMDASTHKGAGSIEAMIRAAWLLWILPR